MNIPTMRRVDRWLGVPMCAALTGHRRLRDLLGGRAPRPIRRILFIKLAEQGSTVLAVSALRRAAEMVGRENVYFLVFEENRFILDLMDLIPPGNVIAIPTNGIGGTLFHALRTVRRMRQLEFDAAIDLEFFARSSAVLAFLSGAARRVGFHRHAVEGPYRGDLMTHRLRYSPHLHTAQTFRTLVDALAVDGDSLPTSELKPVPLAEIENAPPFEPGDEQREHVRGLIAEAAGNASFRPLVLLNANCSDLLPIRAWPRDRYVALAGRLLAARPDLTIGLTGAPDETEAARALVAEVGSDRCFCLAGRTTLRELLVVCTLADVMVTNDSGPAHFATLTPIDVVTLFGPEHPGLFGARSPRNHVLWAGLACSPCVSALNNRTTPCRNNLCLQAIGVDQVFETVCRLLDARAEAGRAVPRPLVTTISRDPAAYVGDG